MRNQGASDLQWRQCFVCEDEPIEDTYFACLFTGSFTKSFVLLFYRLFNHDGANDASLSVKNRNFETMSKYLQTDQMGQYFYIKSKDQGQELDKRLSKKKGN